MYSNFSIIKIGFGVGEQLDIFRVYLFLYKMSVVVFILFCVVSMASYNKEIFRGCNPYVNDTCPCCEETGVVKQSWLISLAQSLEDSDKYLHLVSQYGIDFEP